mmetsp:Transcript_95221/g.269118  ORF Transcript_95221/g.269118 Transcript_95221/m.269118 type:complete len:114 (-) Transcript_95221:144-485(-)
MVLTQPASSPAGYQKRKTPAWSRHLLLCSCSRRHARLLGARARRQERARRLLAHLLCRVLLVRLQGERLLRTMGWTELWWRMVRVLFPLVVRDMAKKAVEDNGAICVERGGKY